MPPSQRQLDKSQKFSSWNAGTPNRRFQISLLISWSGWPGASLTIVHIRHRRNWTLILVLERTFLWGDFQNLSSPEYLPCFGTSSQAR